MTFGEELRRERELRGIDLAEISEGTKVSLRLLQALERNAFDELPGGLFTRGFIRAYANHIGADPDRLVNAYLLQLTRSAEDAGNEPHQGPRLEGGGPAPRPRRTRLVAGLAVSALGLLALAAILWGLRGAPQAPAEDTPAPAPVARPERTLEVHALDDNRVQVTCAGEVRMDRTLSAGESASVRCAGELRLDASSAGDLELVLDGEPLGVPGERGTLLLGWSPDEPPA